MIGWEFSGTRLNPAGLEPSAADDHGGFITVRTASAYGLFGISNRLNLLVRLPYEHWHQFAEHPDNHHRTQTVAGLADAEIGLRWLLKNQIFGPGQRLYLGWNLSLPTGSSYRSNPFAEDADQAPHSHLAVGDGHFASSFYLEWWRRSDFPFVVGILSSLRLPLGRSRAGFQAGQVLSLNLQAVYQRPVVRKVFPYFKLKFRTAWPDHWQGRTAPNSGGRFLGGSAAVIWQFSSSLSAIPAVDFPLWRSVRGDQLGGTVFSLSMRKIFQ